MRRFSFKPALDLRGRKFLGLRGFSGKPFHPPLTDIPIGAYMIGPALDVISFFWKGKPWADELHSAAGFVLLAGAIAGLGTLLTGFADWLDTERGTQIRRMANAHASLMILMSSLVTASLLYRYFVYEGRASDLPLLLLALAIMGLAVLGGTIGGSMVYDYGFNVSIAKDNPVYHRHAKDIMHPDEKPEEG